MSTSRGFFFFFFYLFPCQFLTLSGFLIGFRLIHTDVRGARARTSHNVWSGSRWGDIPLPVTRPRSRGRRTWGQRGNYNSTGFHLALSSNHPTCLWAEIKDLQKQTERKKKRGGKRTTGLGGEKEKFNDNKKKKSPQLSKLNVIVSQKGIGNWPGE